MTPDEWHDELVRADNNTTIWIDCRNDKEYQLGHFRHAINPQTTTFQQFIPWVQQNAHALQGKQVRMYCTGGVRCEKASAFIRKTVPTVQNVKHLQGGIHKYLEAYGDDDTLWQGKNFVFDGRKQLDGNERVVGKCTACRAPFDKSMDCVCTVCREPLLVCDSCRSSTRDEYHCSRHAHLKDCYFSNLTRFSKQQLKEQYEQLVSLYEPIRVGKKFKQKRKTLWKQMQKIQYHLENYGSNQNIETSCRNCGDHQCSGKCWGFFSLKRKERLEQKQGGGEDKSITTTMTTTSLSGTQPPKRTKRNTHTNEAKPPTAYRQGPLRIPPPVTRMLSCRIKPAWRGQSALQVIQQEWNPPHLTESLQRGLLRINETESIVNEHRRVHNHDSILSRVSHVHEAPIVLPGDVISFQQVTLSEAVVSQYRLNDPTLWVCDKPTSVPVHPAGPYLQNSLVQLLQGQMASKSPVPIHPLHRIDRVTSGLVLCTPDPTHARWFHTDLNQQRMKKLYVAMVHGHFVPERLVHQQEQKQSKSIQCNLLPQRINNDESISEEIILECSAPIHTSDPANGIRIIDAIHGKSAVSRFQLLCYDKTKGTSLVLCSPLTGRNHQLRVHLQALGHAIVGDLQYGSKEAFAIVPLEHVLSAMSNAQTTDHDHGMDDAIDLKDSEAAKSVCAACRDVTSAFTPAQLLQGGHAIQLHAWKYKIAIMDKKSTDPKVLQELELSVDLPQWAAALTDVGRIGWL